MPSVPQVSQGEEEALGLPLHRTREEITSPLVEQGVCGSLPGSSQTLMTLRSLPAAPRASGPPANTGLSLEVPETAARYSSTSNTEARSSRNENC
jgi:hypothetical protein